MQARSSNDWTRRDCRNTDGLITRRYSGSGSSRSDVPPPKRGIAAIYRECSRSFRLDRRQQRRILRVFSTASKAASTLDFRKRWCRSSVDS